MVSWLVKAPTEQELSRARMMPLAQINKLEEVCTESCFSWSTVCRAFENFPCSELDPPPKVWKQKPEATVDDLEAPSMADAEVMPVALRYEDVHQFQKVGSMLGQL